MIIILIILADSCRLDIIESESIIKFIKFKKEGEKVKKNKIKKKRGLSEYIEQQINNKKYYHWSLGLIILIFINTGDTWKQAFFLKGASCKARLGL